MFPPTDLVEQIAINHVVIQATVHLGVALDQRSKQSTILLRGFVHHFGTLLNYPFKVLCAGS